MKRNLLIFGVTLAALVGVSCERHSWEDTVETKVEKIYSEDNKLVDTKKTQEIKEKGTKRFFYEDTKKKSVKKDGAPAEGKK